jgi:drug/metabolite transporter (DMT)-like permease
MKAAKSCADKLSSSRFRVAKGVRCADDQPVRAETVAMSSSVIGLACFIFFAVSQGARDAFFGNVFQSVSFLLVGLLVFATSTLCFSIVGFARRPADLARLLKSPGAFAGLNATTAIGWLSFFYALKHLEPAVVATLYNGVGPLAVLGLQGVGWATLTRRPSAAELLCYVGIAATLAGLAAVVLLNRSGLAVANLGTQGVALAVVLAGGAMIAISHMIARRFNDEGVSSEAVMGTRFVLAIFAAAATEIAVGSPSMRPPAGSIPCLAAAAFALITIPSFMLQLGVARTSPLAVNVIRSLGPVFVFAVQQLDGRLRFSEATLLCVVGFCVFATGASLLRAWREATDTEAYAAALVQKRALPAKGRT